MQRRAAPALKAKRAVEAAVEGKPNVLDVPTVESRPALAEDLRRFGFEMSVVGPGAVDIRKLRDRLGLTQEQFALRFGLELDAVRNWEYGRRAPDAAAKAYLTVIDRDPETREAPAAPVE